jgi:hypothetical protein
VELPKNKTALVAGIAVASIVTTTALGMAVWPALTRPGPPLEAKGDEGLRIRLVEPPKASVATAGTTTRLDVGLSDVAQAMAKGREALFVRTPPVRTPPPPRYAPARVAQADIIPAEDEDDLAPPVERVDDRWNRDRSESGYELAQRRWEDERLARRERDRRVAWEQDQRERRRWEDPREPVRYEEPRFDDRYAPAPPPEDDEAPPPRRW